MPFEHQRAPRMASANGSESGIIRSEKVARSAGVPANHKNLETDFLCGQARNAPQSCVKLSANIERGSETTGEELRQARLREKHLQAQIDIQHKIIHELKKDKANLQALLDGPPRDVATARPSPAVSRRHSSADSSVQPVRLTCLHYMPTYMSIA